MVGLQSRFLKGQFPSSYIFGTHCDPLLWKSTACQIFKVQFLLSAHIYEVEIWIQHWAFWIRLLLSAAIPPVRVTHHKCGSPWPNFAKSTPDQGFNCESVSPFHKKAQALSNLVYSAPARILGQRGAGKGTSAWLYTNEGTMCHVIC